MPSPINHREDRRAPAVAPQTGEERLRLALHAGNIGVWEWDLTTGLVDWQGLPELLRRDPGSRSHSARGLLRLIEPLDRGRLLKALKPAIEDGKPLIIELPVRRRDGEIRWISIRGATEAVEDGVKPRKLIGVASDVTEQKLILSRTDALLREVSHRSKNLLALILAMARLTARDAVDVKSHLKDFTLRVAGLSASQDLIVASDWKHVDLTTLAVAEIGAVARNDAGRIGISGPSVALTPEAAQTLGMVLTELALNAVEHGALSVAAGNVRLSWEIADDDQISITWCETGGPPFNEDGAKGYGMSIVERFSTQGLKLAVNSAIDKSSFKWMLTGPLANIGARSDDVG